MDRRLAVLLCALSLALLSACQAAASTPAGVPGPTALRTQTATRVPGMATATRPPAAAPTGTAAPTGAERPTPVPTATAPSQPEPQDWTWRALSPGIAVRRFDVPAEAGSERVTVTRLDLDTVQFRVLYSPGEPQHVSAWAEQTEALVVVNAGYFTPEHYVTGLTISDGRVYGVPYGDFAGMFAVPEDGAASVRWLRQSPYDPQERLREAVQCFPVLVKPGGVMGFPADADAGQATRRTVVAQDRAGRILFVVAPNGYLGLHALAVWLVESDLDLDVALNLDGGPSSGLWMADGPQIDSLLPVPAVIAVIK